MMKALRVLFALVLIATLASLVYAEEAKRSARVIDLKGEAEVRLAGRESWVPLETDSVLNQGDIVRTKADSYLTIYLNGVGETATVEVTENSQLMMSELTADQEAGTQKTLLDLAIGEVLIKAQKLHTPESKFEVKTPTSIVGVRGTEFVVKVEALE